MSWRGRFAVHQCGGARARHDQWAGAGGCPCSLVGERRYCMSIWWVECFDAMYVGVQQQAVGMGAMHSYSSTAMARSNSVQQY